MGYTAWLQMQQMKRNQFGGDARSRTEIHGFASRCVSIYFNYIRALATRNATPSKYLSFDDSGLHGSTKHPPSAFGI